jgi:N-acetylmuramoyl-L-alanine amidase
MVINIHAGHNPDGKTGCGAIGLIKESTEARTVKNEVIRQLQLLGHTVYDCTCDNGKNQADVLSKIVAKCNAHTVDIDVSIHFNSGANDKAGNGKSTGTETYVCNSSSKASGKAKAIADAIANLGFKNRGVKTNSSLYVLRKTKAPAVLVECCFVDDADDVKLYDAYAMASAIVYGITGEKYEQPAVSTDTEAEAKDAETAQGNASDVYRVQVGAFKNKANAEKLVEQLKAAGFSAYVAK